MGFNLKDRKRRLSSFGRTLEIDDIDELPMSLASSSRRNSRRMSVLSGMSRRLTDDSARLSSNSARSQFHRLGSGSSQYHRSGARRLEHVDLDNSDDELVAGTPFDVPLQFQENEIESLKEAFNILSDDEGTISFFEIFSKIEKNHKKDEEESLVVNILKRIENLP